MGIERASMPVVFATWATWALVAACASTGPAPLLTLPDLEGRSVEVAAQSPQQITVLAFWATWCQPCQSELARMNAMYRELSPRGLALYAIDIDGPDTYAQVAPWVAREGYVFPVLVDAETRVLTRYHPRGEIPFYVVLDARGTVLRDHPGYNEGDVEELRDYLDCLLPPG